MRPNRTTRLHKTTRHEGAFPDRGSGMIGGMGMDSTQMDASAQEPFRSALQNAAERFLAHAIDHALKVGRRTAKDFIRHFPPATIMAGLEDEPQLRANIMVTATGIKMKVALKKP